MLGGGTLCAEQSHTEELFNNNVARAANRYRSGQHDHTGDIEALTRAVSRVFIARGQPAAPRRRRLFPVKAPGMHVRATAFDARCRHRRPSRDHPCAADRGGGGPKSRTSLTWTDRRKTRARDCAQRSVAAATYEPVRVNPSRPYRTSLIRYKDVDKPYSHINSCTLRVQP